MKLMGLFHARGTLVGNEINRGISGGEKKRLTTAEQVGGGGEAGGPLAGAT
jgi:hypothetical protein